MVSDLSFSPFSLTSLTPSPPLCQFRSDELYLTIRAETYIICPQKVQLALRSHGFYIRSFNQPWADCTMPFYIRDWHMLGSWKGVGSWNQSPADTKGPLYYVTERVMGQGERRIRFSGQRGPGWVKAIQICCFWGSGTLAIKTAQLCELL